MSTLYSPRVENVKGAYLYMNTPMWCQYPVSRRMLSPTHGGEVIMSAIFLSESHPPALSDPVPLRIIFRFLASQ